MELISVAANPPALMKSNNELRRESKGLDSGPEKKEKFVDILSAKTEISKDAPEKPSVKIAEVKKNPDPVDKVDKVDKGKEDLEEDSPNSLAEVKGFQIGPKVSKPKTEREKAILEFMDSFESEFRIPPQEMVAAMAKLSQGQLTQSPEETADGVISKLKLDEDQENAAKGMYVGLLMQLHQIDQKNPTSPMEPVSNKALLQPQVQQRVELGQSRKLQRDMSIESLSNRFWMKNPESQGNITPEMKDALVSKPLQSPGFLDTDRMRAEELDPSQGFDQQALNSQIMDLQALEIQDSNGENVQIAPEDMKKIAQQIMKQKGLQPQANGKQESESSAALATLKSAERPMQGSDVKTQEFMVQREAAGLESQSYSQGEGGFQSQAGYSQSESKNGMMKPEDKVTFGKKGAKMNVEDMSFRQLSSAVNPEVSSLKSGELSKLGAGPLPLPGRQDPAVTDANVRQVMNQAQYLIKNGGGEMKVQMSPEGLGSIELKVLVSNGKVNVQMLTENKEVKNAIENSMADLKNSLSAQKLSVEHIKVDVVGATNTDNQSQGNSNSNLNGHNQRDATRQFWNQFQENFGSRSQRDNFFDINAKGYTAKRDRDPLQPIEGTSKARLKEGKGSGLNLVA